MLVSVTPQGRSGAKEGAERSGACDGPQRSWATIGGRGRPLILVSVVGPSVALRRYHLTMYRVTIMVLMTLAAVAARAAGCTPAQISRHLNYKLYFIYTQFLRN
jgi:hypothetical protein